MENEKVFLVHENEKLTQLKMDRWFATFHHRSFIFMAIAGSSAVLGGSTALINETLPRWADISLIAGGLLTGPSSIVQLPITRSWMEKAREDVKSQEIVVHEDLGPQYH